MREQVPPDPADVGLLLPLTDVTQTLPFAEPSRHAVAGRGVRARRTLATITRIALWFIAMVLFLTLARSIVADEYHVPTGSMWPTIAPGDRILVDKVAYGLRIPFTDIYLIERAGPRPGDIVVFVDPRGGQIPLVKRVVAVAGQTVEAYGSQLYVDGVAQRLEVLGDGSVIEHLGAITHGAGRPDPEAFGPVVVPPGKLFVMGDNRASSLDSRVMGPVPARLVRGRVVGVLYHEGAGGFDPERLLLAID